MKGRVFFVKYKKIFNAIVKLIKLFPVSVRMFLFNFSSGFPGGGGAVLRYIFIKSLLNKSGVNIYIGRWVVVKNPKNISIGNNVSIHDYCYIDGSGNLEIGDNVSIAHNSSVLTFEHTFIDPTVPIKYQPLKYGRVIIEQNVWIGCGCRVLSGSKISSDTVVGANSVVTRDVGSGLYVGTPARKVKELR